MDSSKKIQLKNILFVDKTFFDMFSFPRLHGDMNSVLEEPYSIVLAIAFAQVVHPAFENIVGKRFPISSILNFPAILFVPTLVLFIALVSGWLPSVMVSHFSPLSLFRSDKTGRSLKIKAGVNAQRLSQIGRKTKIPK